MGPNPFPEKKKATHQQSPTGVSRSVLQMRQGMDCGSSEFPWANWTDLDPTPYPGQVRKVGVVLPGCDLGRGGTQCSS